MIELRVVTTPADLEAWAELEEPGRPERAGHRRAARRDRRAGAPAAARRARTDARGLRDRGAVALRRPRVHRRARAAGAPPPRCRARARARARRARPCARPRRRERLRRRGRRAGRSRSRARTGSRRSTTSSSRRARRRRAARRSPRTGSSSCRSASRREELLEAAWPVALEGYEDLPLPGAGHVPVRDLAARGGDAAGGLVRGVRGRGDRRLRGADGARRTARRPAEHGLTVVRRDRRGRGIARALKLAQLHWASQRGVVELVTWTQRGNEGDAGAEREPRLREPLARADDAGAAAVIEVRPVDDRGRHRHVRRGPHACPPGEPDAARGGRRGPQAARSPRPARRRSTASRSASRRRRNSAARPTASSPT